jgi:hypothetical protein
MSLTLLVQQGEMLSVNDELSIDVGANIIIENTSYRFDARLYESSTEPAEPREVAASSEEIWVYAVDGDLTISVEEL